MAKQKREPLARERVLRAALELADRAGIEALSMRALATELGVEAMSLYNHVAGKDDLLDGMADAVVEEIELPSLRGNWRTAMRKRARSAHMVLLRHRWASLLIVSRVNVGPAMLRYIDATLGCLHKAGFSYALADHVWNVLDSYIYGFTLQALNFPFEPSEYRSAANDFLPSLSPESHPHMRALTELVASGRHTGVQDFDFGLDLLLDALERRRIRPGGRR